MNKEKEERVQLQTEIKTKMKENIMSKMINNIKSNIKIPVVILVAKGLKQLYERDNTKSYMKLAYLQKKYHELVAELLNFEDSIKT